MATPSHDVDDPTGEAESAGPVIRDRRRIDPSTGKMRTPGAEADQPSAPSFAAASSTSSDGKGSERMTHAAKAAYGKHAGAATEEPPVQSEGEPGLQQQLDERTADLQRVHAEYANYRRRVERDREAVKEQAVAGVVTSLLPLLDDIERAREHGDLTGGFKSVGEALESALSRLGVQRFAEPGDAFDPNLHEAMMHSHSPEVTQTTAVQILQPGYLLGERLLRPARVAVADPE